MCRRKQMDTLLESVNQLEEKYLIAEVTGLPERADDRVFYQVMKAAEKSMLERIGNMQREQREYREYIEQWVHEMKTPITAMKLCAKTTSRNLQGSFRWNWKVKPTDGAGAVYPDIDHNRDSAAVVCMLFYQYMDSVSEIRHGNFIKGLMIYLLYTLL